MRGGIVLAVGLFAPALAAAQATGYENCHCVNRGGERVEVGETACLRVDGRVFTARCGMSLNNPAWRKVRDGCEPAGMSKAPPGSEFREPVDHAVLVDAEIVGAVARARIDE